MTERIASYCSGYYLDKKYDLNRETNRASHPVDEDRLNGIMLVHPRIKFALGCTPAQVDNLRDLNREPRQQGRVYCGGHLYAPYGGKK